MPGDTHDFPTPGDELLREAIELASRVNRRLSERAAQASKRPIGDQGQSQPQPSPTEQR